MPTLMLIDSDGIHSDVHTHTVTDRQGARRIIAYDLQQTSDPKWSAEILSEFDSGADVIQKLNGSDGPHFFRIEYRP